MIDARKIAKVMANFHTVQSSEDGVRIGTSCLFPHGDGIVLTVRLGKEGYLVSDDGIGWSTILSSGLDIRPSFIKKAKKIAEDTGITFDDGMFCLSGIEESQLASGILWTANATQRWVSEVFFGEQRRTERELKQRLLDIIVRYVPRNLVATDVELIGDSNRRYTVDHTIKLANDNLILLQSIVNNANAITNNFVKLVDIKKANPDFRREIAIEGIWKAEDLNLVSEASDEIVQLDHNDDLISKKIRSLVA